MTAWYPVGAVKAPARGPRRRGRVTQHSSSQARTASDATTKAALASRQGLRLGEPAARHQRRQCLDAATQDAAKLGVGRQLGVQRPVLAADEARRERHHHPPRHPPLRGVGRAERLVDRVERQRPRREVERAPYLFSAWMVSPPVMALNMAVLSSHLESRSPARLASFPNSVAARNRFSSSWCSPTVEQLRSPSNALSTRISVPLPLRPLPYSRTATCSGLPE